MLDMTFAKVFDLRVQRWGQQVPSLGRDDYLVWSGEGRQSRCQIDTTPVYIVMINNHIAELYPHSQKYLLIRRQPGACLRTFTLDCDRR